MPPIARQQDVHTAKRTAESRDGTAKEASKPSQRQRLVDAMIELSARGGYQSVSIAQLSAHAGVSSATFYEQFEDKEDCLVEAYQAAARGVLDQMTPVPADEQIAPGQWSEEARAALRRLLAAVQSEPDCARVLYFEPLAAGSKMHKARIGVLGEFERRSQDFLDSSAAAGSTLDLPAVALMGAVRSIVSRHLRSHAEDELPALADDLVAWVEAYTTPGSHKRWSTSPEALLPAAAAQMPDPALRVPAPGPERLPRGRHGLSASMVVRSQRTRILYGTAETMMAKGYASTTVADIVAAAGVARDVFYEHFTDKQHAFLEAQQHPTQHILDTCAMAYFSGDDWPERVWRGLGSLIALIVENPALSHLRLVESYAAGPDAIRRAEDITRSFAIFLEEGYRYRPQASELPRLCSQAISGAIFEVVQRHVGRGDFDGLTRQLPLLSYVAIAPFTGPEEAVEKLEQIASGDTTAPLARA